jgi:hypothetical protein
MVPAGRVGIGRLFVEPAGAGHVRFTTDDRLDTCAQGFGVKLHGPEHVAMIGDRQRGHMVLFGLLNHLIQTACAVQQRILTVRM